MSGEQSIKQWARTADFGEPLRWGSVESAALEHTDDADLPTPELLARMHRAERASRVLMTLWRVGQILIPAAGVATVYMALRSTDEGVLRGWLFATDLLFIFTIASVFSVLTVFGKARTTWAVVSIVWAAVASTTALLLARVAWLGLTHVVIIVAAVMAIVTIVILLFRRKAVKQPQRERLGDLTPEQIARKGARAQVLEVLVKRGLVKQDDIDIPMMVDMPLGSWHELDTPDR